MLAKWRDNLRESCDVRLAAGCGCALAWTLIVAVSPVLSTSSTFIGNGLTWRSGLAVGATLAFGILAIVCCRVSLFWSAEAKVPSVPLAVAAAVLSPAGALLHWTSGEAIAAALAGAAVGCGLAALVLAWAPPFAAMRLRKRVVGTVASVFVGGFFYLVITFMPQPFSFVAALGLVPLSLFLSMLIGRFPAAGEDEAAAGEDVLEACASLGAQTGPCLCTSLKDSAPPSLPALFGPELSLAVAIYGALFVLAGHALPEDESAWMASPIPGLVNVILFLVVEAALTLYMVKRVRRENPRVAYRPATALVAVGFLLLPFGGAAASLLCAAIAFAGFGCFLVYLWIVLGNMGQRWRVAPVGLVAYGFLLLFAGIIAGEVGAWILYHCSVSFSYVATISIVALFLLVLVAWSMTDGSRYAHETAEMGGAPAISSDVVGGVAEAADGATNLKRAARECGLSPREVEVLTLLLRGRSIPYICDELFIAKSTAQTHVRHIYAKMDITGGRQELIDRIERGTSVGSTFPAKTER